MNNNFNRFLVLPVVCALVAGNAAAESADEVARRLANPNDAIAKLTFKNQYREYTGDLPTANSQGNYTLLFQPVFPFDLGENERGAKKIFFVRPALPLAVDQPVPSTRAGGFDFEGETGFGDIGFDIGAGATEKNGLLWAVGAVGTLPSATEERLSGKQWRVGPEFLLAKFEKWGLYGVFPSHQWRAGGWDDGGKGYSVTQVQPLFTVLPGGGWSVGSSPIMNYDWKENEATVPVNLTIGKTIVMGKTPVKLELDLNYYVTQPDAFGPKWMVGFNLTPVVHNFIDTWVRGR